MKQIWYDLEVIGCIGASLRALGRCLCAGQGATAPLSDRLDRLAATLFDSVD